jgi:hypothetical protein
MALWVSAAIITLGLIIAKTLGAGFSWFLVAVPMITAGAVAITALLITLILFRPLFARYLSL